MGMGLGLTVEDLDAIAEDFVSAAQEGQHKDWISQVGACLMSMIDSCWMPWAFKITFAIYR